MAINRSNSEAFNDAEKYSQFVIQTLPDIMLPDNMYRNVSDFADGKTLNIPTIGSATIQEVAEGMPLNFTAIDSGTVTLEITDYIGDAWYVSDEARQDHARLRYLEVARAQESVRALAEYQETRLLRALNLAQVNGNPNTINGAAHRIASAVAGNVFDLDHLRRMKFAFDKARVPQGGRILIVDPSVEYTLNGLAQVVTSDNPMFQGIITEGFAQNHKFIRNIYGFDIWTSDFLDKGSFSDGTTTVANGVANVAMSVVSDQHVPIMYAERKSPSVEGWRDNEERREKFQTTYRAGWGAQRVDTLGVIITSAAI
jgi:hypothetical protein